MDFREDIGKMIKFKILKKSKKSNARLGIIETSNGKVETPALVTVATQAVVKTLTSHEAEEAKSQMLICNTYHLHLKQAEKIVKKAGGLHKFMNWQRPLMTDSGGFQVFSLGFGRDHGVGKILKKKKDVSVSLGEQPKLLNISEKGVEFRSPIDGRKIFLGPKESMKIQEELGADIIFAFDECTSPVADYEYTKKSLALSHKWAIECLKARSPKAKKNQALFGIVQGGKFSDLRRESAKFISSLPFDGFGIGGEFGDDKKIMGKMLEVVLNDLPEEKPRHLLGIGHLEDIPEIIKAGVDTFDCIVPTHYARHGTAFSSDGRLDMRQSKFLKDKKPLDKNCACYVCRDYTRSYISHLFKAGEITALKLLTFHNLYFFNSYIEKLREDIKKGKL